MAVHSLRRLATLSAASCVALATTSQAAILNWRSTATAGVNWSDPNNWAPVQAPVNGDALTFNNVVTGGSRNVNNDIAGLQIASVMVNGNAFFMNGLGIGLLGDYTFTAGGSNLHTVNFPVTLLNNINVAVPGSRIDWNGPIDGNFGLTKTSTGTLRLQGAANLRTYTGDTLASAGTLDLNGLDALPYGAGKGDVLIDAGAFLTPRAGQQFNALRDGPNGGGTIQAPNSGTKTLFVGVSGASGSFSGTINNGSGGIAITKTGAGTQIFAGAGTNGYTGVTNITGGQLLIDNATASTTINAGTASLVGTLGGTGTVGNVNINGIGRLSPGGSLTGDTTATLDFTGNLFLAAASTTTLEVDGLIAEVSHDQVRLSATGLLTAGGTLNIDFGVAAATGTYDLFSFTVPAAGNFAGVNLTGVYGSTPLVETAAGTGVYSADVSGTNFTFTRATGDLVVAVPEPTTLAALAGIGAMALRRRR